MDYKSTAVNWASYIREMFMEYVYETYQTLKFDVEVETDESLFGRNEVGLQKTKYGFLESLNAAPICLCFIPIIQKHVRPGTIIYSDNWAAYF